MRITIICSNREHPIYPELQKWGKKQKKMNHTVSIVQNAEDIKYGDLLFLISCNELVNKKKRAN